MKRSFVVFSLLIIASMVLAACGGAAPPAPECTDPIGCVTIGPDEPIHIAYAFVTSGSDATLGLDTKYGAEIAIDDRGGKLLEHDIKFDGQDSGCNAEGGTPAAPSSPRRTPHRI